jgi:thiosulfate/3-mercaptopyruvate sulfurtransferase
MSQYACPEILVETPWLMAHLDDPMVRVLEVDMSPAAHSDTHIPGAVFWNTLTDLLTPSLSMNLDPTAMANLLSRSGISRDTTVIAYGSYPGTGAWIFWLLKLFGHENVLVLNGGHQKWLADACPVASAFAEVIPTQYAAIAPDATFRVLQSEVEAALGRADCVLLDVRTPQEYSGEVYLLKPPQGDERGGHIPGAVHLEHTLTLNEDGTFKSAEALQTLFYSHGVTPDKMIFPYCAIGARAGYMWFVLKYLLGYPQVRNYDGSWNEWSRLSNTPVE